MVLLSITSKEFAFDISSIEDMITRKIFVYDNQDFASTVFKDNQVTIYLKGLNGSYFARNQGLEYVNEGEKLLMIDDDVKILLWEDFNFDDNTLYVPNITVIGQPSTLLEEWYKSNAFDQKKFISKDNFAPTICWAMIYNGFNFNSTLLSGGDVEASKVFSAIEFRQELKIATNLRSTHDIKKKFRRQVFGMACRKGFLFMSMYAFKCLFFGVGTRKLSRILPRRIAGVWKFIYVMETLLWWLNRRKKMRIINNIEVNA